MRWAWTASVRSRLAGWVLGGFAGAIALGDPSGAWAGELADVPAVEGGRWVRIANLKDAEGRFQARQEHSAVTLNGYVYLIGGFVPRRPPPEPTEENPEPFAFRATDEVLAYVPQDHPAAGGDKGTWRSLAERARFPEADAHHIMSVAHAGRIWSFGGHAGGFAPTDRIYAFRPKGPATPEGRWSKVAVADAGPCDPDAEACLRLPRERAAGAVASLGGRIYVLGGVVPNEGARDPRNQSIRTTASVLSLDTGRSPLRWRVEPPMLAPREHFNAVVAEGRIWVFHGRNERSTHMRGVESWAPGEPAWRREPAAPIGTSANVLARVGECVYSFGGEFIASNVTGTIDASQVFHIPSRTWRLVASAVAAEPLDASGATSKHGTYGLTYTENGRTRIMAPGGASLAWFAPMSRVHVFDPPARCER